MTKKAIDAEIVRSIAPARWTKIRMVRLRVVDDPRFGPAGTGQLIDAVGVAAVVPHLAPAAGGGEVAAHPRLEAASPAGSTVRGDLPCLT